MSTQKLRVGYVPEHFAAPLLQLADSEWQEGGQKIDVAVALTEALITGIAKGRTDYKLVGSYVRTSLNWAVITGTSSFADKYQNIDDLQGGELGISRIGSGSQIMASVMALNKSWPPNELKFKVNDTFANLRAGVNGKSPYESAAFMWEWYTTKPYADSGEIRFIGNVPTPWPSWTIAASNTVTGSSSVLPHFLEKLQDSIRQFANPENRASGSCKSFILSHHDYDPKDVESWLETVRWAGESTPNPSSDVVPKVGQNTVTSTVSTQTIQHTLQILQQAAVFSGSFDPASFVDTPERLVE
ncbi:hypothetical protein BCV70DRAFT_196836 [Testicularia cyperi]|uniref:Ca3427-like PBP 2 domain-containing protein n=1 Tax=Testicularia cyperi TaxID=1882483 RepID=A0A317XWD6_9BASI|nr:hypothetical protein BCV70DRAFT_196836 [Testicularia cyperi]